MPVSEYPAPDTPAVTPRQLLLSLQPQQRLRFAAAGLTLLAGFSHALAGEEHFTIWWGYGLFFSIVSICQIMGGGALLFWSSRTLYRVGVAGTSFVIILYVVTRTLGIPFGPEAGQVEGVGVLDAFSKTFEVAYLSCLIALLRRPPSRREEG